MRLDPRHPDTRFNHNDIPSLKQTRAKTTAQDQSRASFDSHLLNFVDNHPANTMGANPSSLQAGVPPAQDADDDVQVLGSRAVRPANAPTPGSSAPRQTMIPPPAEAFAPAPRAPLAEADTNRPVEAPVRHLPIMLPTHSPTH